MILLEAIADPSSLLRQRSPSPILTLHSPSLHSKQWSNPWWVEVDQSDKKCEKKYMYPTSANFFFHFWVS